MEKREHYAIPNAHPLEIGLSWDFIGEEIDLDAHICAEAQAKVFMTWRENMDDPCCRTQHMNLWYKL